MVKWLLVSLSIHQMFVKQLLGETFLLKSKLPFEASMSKTLHPSCITGREGLQHRTCQSKMWINVAKGERDNFQSILESSLIYYRGVQRVARVCGWGGIQHQRECFFITNSIILCDYKLNNYNNILSQNKDDFVIKIFSLASHAVFLHLPERKSLESCVVWTGSHLQQNLVGPITA